MSNSTEQFIKNAELENEIESEHYNFEIDEMIDRENDMRLLRYKKRNDKRQSFNRNELYDI